MIALLRTTEDMDDWEYDIEEVLGEDGSTVGSLVVRFALPQDVTSAAGLELLCEPEEALSGSAAAAGLAASPASGYALVIKSADRQGAHLDSLPRRRMRAAFPEAGRTIARALSLVLRLRLHVA